MTHRDVPDDRNPPSAGGIDEPSVAGLARWLERSRLLRGRIEAARAEHASVDLGLGLLERDSSIGGGLLGGALAYRLFVLLLPSALLFVSGLGLYAGTVDESPRKVAREAGLHGLIASHVASTASSGARGLVFLVMIPAVLYAAAKLYRAIAVVHGLAWHGSGRGVRLTPMGFGLLLLSVLLAIAAGAIVGGIRHHDQLGGLSALLVYLILVGGAWLALSLQLPHRQVRWPALLPGAVLVGAGSMVVNVFNVYVTTRLVEDRANTYGALGIAAALLFSLVLVGRLMVLSAELNASLADYRARSQGPPPPDR